MSNVKRESIQLVLCDMDGTLLLPDHSISAANVRAVKQLQDAGVHFTLASGRPPRAMREQIAQLGIKLPTAAFNGGVLVDAQGHYLLSHHVPIAAVRHTLALLSDYPVDVWVFADDQWYLKSTEGPMVAHEQSAMGYAPVVVESFEPHLHRVDKIVGASRDAELLIELEQQLHGLLEGEALASRSQAFYLDVTALKANKGDALVALADLMAVSLRHTMAIGDGGNDPAMFAKAGLSVAMGQADESIRKQADEVTGSNVEDGVAQAIERFILNIGSQ